MANPAATPDPKALHAKLQDFRLKITRGETVTDDELRQAIRDLHAYRNGSHKALEASATKRATKKADSSAKAKAKQDAQNLLGGLL